MSSLRHVSMIVGLLSSMLQGPLVAQTQFRMGRLYTPASSIASTNQAVAGDFDGDGFEDIVLATIIGVDLLSSDRHGGFTNVTSARISYPRGRHVRAVSLADLDGDGDLDLLTAEAGAGPSRLYENDGAGNYTAVTTSGLASWDTWAIAVFDADLDQDLDVLHANWNGDRLYLNQGNLTFQDVTNTHFPPHTQSIEALPGDLDGDGDQDLLISDLTFSRIELNDGTGHFAQAPPSFFPYSFLTGAANLLEDVDGNGTVDWLAEGYSHLFLQRPGGGGFVDARSNVPLTSPNRYGVTFVDVDRDGDPDLLGARVLMLNDGNGVFQDVTSSRMPATLPFEYGRTAAGDFDGDGDPDLYATLGGSMVYLLMNFDRQLDALNPPTIGTPYTLDVHVQPGYGTTPHLVRLFAAAGDGYLPWPPLGTLGLDLATLAAVSSWRAVASGTTSVTYPIPLDTQLQGHDVFFQALILDPTFSFRLANTIRETVR